MNALFITAGIGSKSLEEAADRLAKDVSQLRLFRRIEIITQTDLPGVLKPYLSHVPYDDLTLGSKFGYYAWKPALAQLAFDGIWGDFDCICYLDAGCEVLPSYWTRRNLQKYLQKSAQVGAVVFHSFHPENHFTTQELFSLFPKIDPSDNTPQFQAGSWIMAGSIGKDLVNSWFRLSRENYSLITDSFDKDSQSKSFIAPRNDQSFFSLTLKSAGIEPEAKIPPGGGLGLRTRFRSFFFPFRWARNRTGQNQGMKIYRLLGLFSLRIYFTFSRN